MAAASPPETWIMAKIAAGTLTCDVEMAVFDKDGTLIDFFHLWGRKARLAVEGVVAHVGGDDALAARLYRSIGFDPASGRAIPNSPLAVTSMPKIYMICATVLYQHGLDWHAAEDAAMSFFAVRLGEIPVGDLVRPLGDVAGLFQRLSAAGVKIAVVTSDNRQASLETLRLLEVDAYVAGMVCGDDPVANKPAPDALHQLSRELGVPLDRAMMIGDSLADLSFGANAGVGCKVALLCGTGGEAEMRPHADVVLPSIDHIRVLT